MEKGAKSHKKLLTFTPWILILTHLQQTAFENIVGKEEIAHNEQFLLFPQCFLLDQKIVSPFVNIFDIISLFAAELEEPKLACEVKGCLTCNFCILSCTVLLSPFTSLWDCNFFLMLDTQFLHWSNEPT